MSGWIFMLKSSMPLMKSSKQSMIPFTPGIAATSSNMHAHEAGLPTMVLT